MADRSRWFVSTEWLAAHLDDPGIVVVDGSWHLPGTRDAAAEYAAGHIPGAVFFDIDSVADTDNPLPHMLPTPERFAEAVGALGIDERQRIVVYDSVGLASAPRVWWTFRIMGARDVVILEGGLPKWRAEGRPVTDAPTSRRPRAFRAAPAPDPVRDLAAVRANVDTAAFQLLDARPRARFLGEAPEPRAWVRSGRVPGSFSLPSTEVVADGALRDEAALRAAIAAAGIDLAKPVVTSCGSGVNAAILTLALDTLGVPSAIYDGSWTEWGDSARSDLPIATGPAKA
ncbi:MAG: 3-mercaptopyruvate sulfurtransferase [Anaerolineae bacterium]|nr:3-mercaptopyruvate sulfurtransferase [Anaerolineae bacterium]